MATHNATNAETRIGIGQVVCGTTGGELVRSMGKRVQLHAVVSNLCPGLSEKFLRFISERFLDSPKGEGHLFYAPDRRDVDLLTVKSANCTTNKILPAARGMGQ